jgi:uncharacterized iron-regulated membrane protein
MQLAGVVIGLGILAMSLILGAFLLAGLLGFALIVAAVVGVRLWWLRRSMRRAGAGEGSIIEAEYRIVRTRPADRRDGEP